jgi:hypothetical protein
MASEARRCRRRNRLAHGAIGMPIDDELDFDELSGDWFMPGVDPHYADLPCYVPLIDDDGLEPFALDAPPERH